jgi:histidine ammonia-lyase
MHLITNETLTFESIAEIIANNIPLQLSPASKEKIIHCRQYLDQKIKTQSTPIYGINTGFGSLYNVSIEEKDLSQLQKNLMMSHACGTGEQVPLEIVKLMLLLKIQSLSYGKSAVQLVTVERLIDFYNHDILPVVYTQGSLGASGDLSPLAHLCLPLLGLGEVNYKNEKKSAAEVLQILNLEPIELQSKEGLALLNGTQFMSAYGTWCLLHAKKLSIVADYCGAVSLEGFDGRIEPFKPHLHTIRPHAGQIETANNMRQLLEGSELINRHKEHVQDPYSFRCIPQVHGASKDAIAFAEKTFLTEINAVTDNPTVFPEEDEILSGGNFHGQALSIALDVLCIALSELGNISERRTYQLISGLRKLPAFLVANPGLNSGFMIPQYTAASIVSQNKQYCSPASVDSIVSSNGQEDHVSMGANAAVKCAKVVENVFTILGIELLNGMQALDFRKPLKSSPIIEKMRTSFRQEIAFVQDDVIMYPEIAKSVSFIKNNRFIN